MIKINHLTITQNKDLRDLVSDLNITIQDGEKVAIIGEEGNGKSTLLRALMGEALPDFTIKGDIQSDLQSLTYIPQHLPEELKKKISAGLLLFRVYRFGLQPSLSLV